MKNLHILYFHFIWHDGIRFAREIPEQCTLKEGFNLLFLRILKDP